MGCNNKTLPSCVSSIVAYALHADFGGLNCLQAVNMNVVQALKGEFGGEALLQFVSADFAGLCEDVYASLNISQLIFTNVWDFFSAILPLVFPHENHY